MNKALIIAALAAVSSKPRHQLNQLFSNKLHPNRPQLKEQASMPNNEWLVPNNTSKKFTVKVSLVS